MPFGIDLRKIYTAKLTRYFMWGEFFSSFLSSFFSFFFKYRFYTGYNAALQEIFLGTTEEHSITA